MKKKVSDNPYYSLEVDYSKNRVYLTILKKWREEEDFSSFIEEWQEVISKITIDFTLICDFRLMPVLSVQMVELFEGMQEYVTRNGLCHLAEIGAEDDIPNLQLARISERSKVPMKRFKTFELADRYLDRFLKGCG